MFDSKRALNVQVKRENGEIVLSALPDKCRQYVNVVPRGLSLPRESTLVMAGHLSMHANPIRTEGGAST